MAASSAAACSACAGTSPPGARFCMQCGAPLAHGCASCGSALPEGARFCPGCGAASAAAPATAPAPERTPRAYTPKHLADKILASRAALEGERKQVTVLFADVRGSMELAEQVDAEQWHAILDRFFAILTDGVHRFEGTVNQYTGDGIMALFGAPLAHEDHAQRACYAALHLRDALREFAQELRRERGLDFATRIGINSGEVVVGKIGDDLRMDYTAQGATVGLAQRMESLAEAGRIYLSAGTAQLAQGYFALADLGEFRVKGVAEPVRVHELLGIGALRTRFDVSRARGLSKLVGRDDDLAALEAALRRAREGQGRVVGVVAEAGTGKSRLCFELAERCRAQGIAVFEGRCLAHGRMIPFVPIRELLRALFGIAESDDAAAVRRKIAGTMLLADRELESELALVFDFLGAPDPQRPAPRVDPEAGAHQLGRIVRQLVKDASARAPCVVLIEDLHWIDAASDALLAQLAESVAGSQTLLVANFRPEYRASWMQRSHYQQLALAPLGPEATAALLRDLLGADASTARLAGEIHAHTGGNPFFVEEVVQALIEQGRLTGARGAYRYSGGEGLGVPAQVQDLLAARIDRLPEREKQLLGVAAVIGRELPEALLREVAELREGELRESAARLVAAELLVEASLYPRLVYGFKHPLTREVAYQAQLAARRTKLHAAVARALIAHEREHLDEAAAEIAHHFEQAGEALDAARWHARAARVLQRGDATAAERHCRAVLRVTDGLAEDGEVAELVIEAGFGLLLAVVLSGMVDHQITPEHQATFERAGRLARARGDDHALARLHALLAWMHAIATFDRAAVVEHDERACEHAARSGDAELIAAVRQRSCFSLQQVFGASVALPRLEQTLAEIPADPFFGRGVFGLSPYERTLNNLAFVLRDSGRISEGKMMSLRARAAAERLGSIFSEFTNAATTLALARAEGDLDAALKQQLDAVALAARLAHPGWHSVTLGGLSSIYEQLGDLPLALAAADQSIALYGRTPSNAMRRALALARLGDAAQALRELELAEADFAIHRRWVGNHLDLARCWRLAAGVSARDRIAALLDSAQTLIDERGERLLQPAIHTERGELALLLGDPAGFARELREAQRLYAEMELPRQVEHVARRLAEVLGSAAEERGA